VSWRAPGAARRADNLAVSAGRPEGGIGSPSQNAAKASVGALVGSRISAPGRATSAPGPGRAKSLRLGSRPGPPAVVPKHVASCFNNGGRSLSVWTFRRSEPEKKTRQVFKCKSWRCIGNDGECSRFERRLTYARIKEAIDRDKLSADGWVFLVLTLDREGTFSGRKRWRDADEAFRDLSRMSRKFFEKLRAWQRRRGMRPIGREWVAVVEAHRSGWPHVNFMVWSPELAEHIEREQESFAEHWQSMGLHPATLPPELMGLARASHWGTLSTAERVRSQDRVVNYISKLAGEAGQALSELAKLTQLPRNAPQRFRRLRAGKSWLPPRRKNPDITGSIVLRKYDKNDGSPVVFPVNNVKDPALVSHMAQVCYEEARLWERERLNAPALAELKARIHSLRLPTGASEGDALVFAKAQRDEISEAYRTLLTPLVYSVALPVPLELEPAPIATGPPARAAPGLDQLKLEW
jgi:hypothetical protein